MAVNIHSLVAAISPDIYCDSSVRKDVKEILKKDGYLKAAEKAKPIKSDVLFNYDEAKRSALKKWGLKSPIEQHSLTYDSPAEGLEPIYFWLLDFLNSLFNNKVEKVSDNFSSTVGSGHFSEIGQKQTKMQEEAMKMLGAANQVIKSILNIIYDLKEFKILLSTYDDLKSSDEKTREASRLSLKQRWLDSVDLAKRGNSSIRALSAQFDWATLIDAFMVANSQKDIDDLDLNDRVKRVLRQRVADFSKWLTVSDSELRKRFEIEKRYLQSQVNTLKLYSRWMKPYLKAAQKLEQKDSSNPALVSTFNTLILELILMANSEYNPKDDVKAGNLPKIFEEGNLGLRKYSSIVIVEFNFRGIPQRVSQRGDWAFGGKTELKFTSYALNEQELKIFKEEYEKDNFGDMLQLIEGTTTESMEVLQKDVDEFLQPEKEEKKMLVPAGEDTNPFTALFSFLKPMKKGKKKEEWTTAQAIKPDTNYEQIVRSQAIIDAREKCFTTFETFKKSRRMPSAPASPYEPI